MSRVIRWKPVREATNFQNSMERLFEEIWRNPDNEARDVSYSLPVDVYESDEAYTVVTALAGIDPDNIDISLHDNVLTISGEVSKVEVDESTKVRLSERHYGKFSRRIKLPNEVDGDQVNANYDNGVLTLALPKVPEAQPRSIPVKINAN